VGEGLRVPGPGPEGRGEAVLFDLDGTLVDSFALIAASFAHAVREVLGRDPTEAELYHRWGAPLRARAEAVAPGRAAELARAYERYYDAHQDQVAVFPGVPEMLQALREHEVRLGVVTSKRRHRAVRTLEAVGLADLFDCVVAEEDAIRPKPAPDPVRGALRALGVSPQGAWMVGDAPFDVLAARSAGVRSVAALWGTREREELLALGPDYVATEPSEVVAAVLG